MDLQRTLLIGAIAVISFMLLTEWVAFKDARNSAASEETTRLISNNGNGELPHTPPIPQVESTGEMEEDLPDVPEQAAAEVPNTPEEPVDSTRFIEVYTDVLQFAIDLKGGDIVELSLREHLARLDKPDQPFVLLEDNDSLVYISQSGLIGPDGIDNSGRAMFTASAPRFTLEEDEDNLIVDLLWQTDSDIKVTKRFILHRGEYLLDIQYLIENNSAQRWQANLFGQIKRQSAPPPAADDNMMGMQPFLGDIFK